jgi:hypothetical protein
LFSFFRVFSLRKNRLAGHFQNNQLSIRLFPGPGLSSLQNAIPKNRRAEFFVEQGREARPADRLHYDALDGSLV